MMSNDPMGYSAVFSNNRYSSFELSVYMQEKRQILTAGTICKNRKGFDKGLFDMDLKIVAGALAGYFTTKAIR